MRGEVSFQHPDRSATVAPWQLFKPQGVKPKEYCTVVIWIASQDRLSKNRVSFHLIFSLLLIAALIDDSYNKSRKAIKKGQINCKWDNRVP